MNALRAAAAVLFGGLFFGLPALIRETRRNAAAQAAAAAGFDEHADQAIALTVVPIRDLITEIDVYLWDQELSP